MVCYAKKGEVMRWLVFLAGGLLFITGVSWLLGTQWLSPQDLWLSWDSASPLHYTIWQYRLPRLILAVLVGAGMATAGALIQSVVNNPLASPDILGISHGAGLAAVGLMVCVPNASVWLLPPVAFIGALVAFGILWRLTRGGGTLRLVITGVALAAFYGALIDYVLLASPLEINTAMVWLTGSLWGRGWAFVIVSIPLFCLLLPLALSFCRDLDAFSLGELKAATLGVRVSYRQVQILLIAAALAASAVAISGPMTFLGLVAPHLARQLVGGQHRILLPTTMLIGALLLQSADLLARTIKPPLELPAGILTALIGAPYFFYLLRRVS